MKKFLFFLSLFVCNLNISAQIHKRFLNVKGEIVKDSIKANTYVLYQKLPDSTWWAIKYNMKGVPILKATYLDEELSFPHGRATHYEQVITRQLVAGKDFYLDTAIKISKTGFYLNGRKEGQWVEFYDNGQKAFTRNYIADTLNGAYKWYYLDGKVRLQGDYVNGLKEGDWYNYYGDSTLREYTKYKHDKPIKNILYDAADKMYSAEAGYKFVPYLYKQLKKSGFPPINGFIAVSFTVDITGKLINPKVEAADTVINSTIIEAINQSPKWIPASFKNHPIEQKLTLILEYKKSNNDNY